MCAWSNGEAPPFSQTASIIIVLKPVHAVYDIRLVNIANLSQRFTLDSKRRSVPLIGY